MAKQRSVFVCRSCGSTQPRWMGKCPDCGGWSTLEETLIDRAADKDPQRGLAATIAAAADLAQRAGEGDDSAAKELAGLEAGVARARPVSEIGGVEDAAGSPGRRLRCGVHEFDRVLGGGLVPGSAVLVGGEPGIGKSTLLLQAARGLATGGGAGGGGKSGGGRRVLYVTSEESAEQIKGRYERLAGGMASAGGTGGAGVPGGAGAHSESDAVAPDPPDADDSLFILADTNLARIIEQARKVKPAVMVVDSVQMIYKSDLPASPGSVTQLRRCCTELVYLAKLSGIALLLVGHVTKEGTLAGPRLLEHLVDAVVYFEGDRYHAHRVVRAVKNRFGTTLEIGLFEMTGAGLREAPEGAGVAAITGDDTPRPGSVVCPVMTGTRCVLVELQALTATGFPGAIKRKSSGLDSSRLAMLIAVLEQHAGLRLDDRDVFASSVGGVRVVEPAADLALLLAIAGAHKRQALAPATCAIGEVGLGGEVRSVGHLDQRLREAARLGYTRAIIPAPPRGRKAGDGRDGAASAGVSPSAIAGVPKGMQVIPARTIGRALEILDPLAPIDPARGRGNGRTGDRAGNAPAVETREGTRTARG